MGIDRGTKCRIQQPEKRIDNTTVSSALQRQQTKYRYNRRV